MSSSPSAAADGRLAFDFEQLTPPPEPARAPSLADASARARAIVAGAEAEAARIRDEARAAGYEEGTRAGRAAALAELGPAAEALTAATRELRSLREATAESIEREAAELGLQVAERVVAGALQVQPERVLDAVRGALRAVVDRERVVVQVSPADLDLVRSALDELRSSLGGIEHIEVQEERRVARGGAILRTTVGELDATLATKLERAQAAVEQELAR